MRFLALLKSIFQTPRFTNGERVNLVVGGGRVKRTDGVVIAQTGDGVLVEWARGGASYESATTLCRIG